MINPWIGVFSQATLEQFLIRSILPKLQEAIENMEINPRRQQLEPWHWTMSWVDIVPLSSMAALLERSFFPRWLRVLDAWLKADPNMEEIPEWYTGKIPTNMKNVYVYCLSKFKSSKLFSEKSLNNISLETLFQLQAGKIWFPTC